MIVNNKLRDVGKFIGIIAEQRKLMRNGDFLFIEAFIGRIPQGFDRFPGGDKAHAARRRAQKHQQQQGRLKTVFPHGSDHAAPPYEGDAALNPLNSKLGVRWQTLSE